MGDLTKNISRKEMACRCGCGMDTVDFELPYVLQDVVDHFQEVYPEKDIRIKLTSANRCKKHNRAEGGADNSQHLYSKAADFYIYDKINGQRIGASKITKYLEAKYPDSYGIGWYNGRTHVDVRPNKVRWDSR